MAGKLVIAALIGVLVIVGAVAGYSYLHKRAAAPSAPQGPKGPQSPAGHGPHGPGGAATAATGGAANASTTGMPAGQASPGPRGPRGGPNGVEINPGVGAACKNIGNGKPIGQNIKWLFDHHSEFRFKLYEYPENKTIIWIIRGPSREALETLVTHIEQMECVIERGGNPRPFDPLFKVDAEISAKYVHTEIKWLNDTAIEVIKKADNDCAWQVIKLHAEVVKGFFTIGRAEAQKTHEIPPDVLEICKPYLESSSG